MCQVNLTRDVPDSELFYRDGDSDGVNITFHADVIGAAVGPLTYTWRIDRDVVNVTGAYMTSVYSRGVHNVDVTVQSILGVSDFNRDVFRVSTWAYSYNLLQHALQMALCNRGYVSVSLSLYCGVF